ncbi:zinc finger (C2H2 type) family protein [Striga hermonthica]|uniref:Zinc finger (C2H2 type) family protein n=1 Tax=Striga hermonthica TaxID=68872 RepID=A0A9N7N4C1_STRHE|nr:zinc finger (C2H2 type) family protein [Striga hermonthica]
MSFVAHEIPSLFAITPAVKCHEQFVRWEAVEEHHLSKHAVTELAEGDSSRKIVEIICRASTARIENPRGGGIERILKVHNMQKTLAQFEEYRELVKIKASKLSKKHPRCLADGNELLRFHGAFLECSLGTKGSCSLCKSENCRVCRILRYGFSTKKELTGGVGVFTASTSARAFESIQGPDCGVGPRKALIVCRVIAGRVHRQLENIQEMVGQTGFDSLAGKVGVHSNIEELYLLSPRALLPCFVVIYKS